MSKDALSFTEIITVHKDNEPDLVFQTIVALQFLKEQKVTIPNDMKTVLLAIVAYAEGIKDEHD